MAREERRIPLTPEHIDHRTLDIILDATKTVAESQGVDYMVRSSFLEGYDQDEVPMGDYTELDDWRIGTYSERGDLETGKLKFIWLDTSAKDFIAEHSGEESLRGQIEFAKQIHEYYFFGAIKLYEYTNGEADIKITASGFEGGYNDELSLEMQNFASSIGLGSLWMQVHERMGTPFPTRFDGPSSRQLASHVAEATRALAHPAGP
jgi:hypothetical protein